MATDARKVEEALERDGLTMEVDASRLAAALRLVGKHAEADELESPPEAAA